MKTIKRLTLLATAAVAATALVGVASASASPVGLYFGAAKPLQFEAESYPVWVSGGPVASTLTIPGKGTMTCEETYFEHHNGIQLSEPSDQLWVHPGFLDCTSTAIGMEFPATVNVNGCIFVFDVNDKKPRGNLGVACPEALAMEFTAAGCTVTIGEQAATPNIAYSNIGTGSNRKIWADVEASGLDWQGCGGSGSDGGFSTEVMLSASS